MAEETKQEQEKKEKVETAEQRRQNHNTRYNNIKKTMDNYKCPEEISTSRAVEKYETIDKKIEQLGINLDNIPEICKPVWVMIYNKINPEEKRTKSAIEKLVYQRDTMGDAVKKSTEYIFDKKSGLNIELQKLNTSLLKNIHASKTLEDEIEEVHQRTKVTKEEIGKVYNSTSTNNLEKITKLSDDLNTYEEALLEYDDLRCDLEGEFEDYSLRSEMYLAEKENILATRNYLKNQKTTLDRAIKRCYLQEHRTDFENVFRQLPTTQDHLNKIKEIIETKRDASYERLNVTADITKKGLNFNLEHDGRESPLKDYEKVNEERSDRIKQMRTEYLTKLGVTP